MKIHPIFFLKRVDKHYIYAIMYIERRKRGKKT